MCKATHVFERCENHPNKPVPRGSRLKQCEAVKKGQKCKNKEEENEFFEVTMCDQDVDSDSKSVIEFDPDRNILVVDEVADEYANPRKASA